MSARYGAFTLRADCPSCGLPVPLNAPMQRAHCHSCTLDFAVPAAVFGELLLQFDDHLPEAAAPYPEGAQAVIDGMQVHATSARVPAAGHEWYPVPDWLRALAPTARDFAVTDRSAVPGAEAARPAVDASHPVAIPCIECGAPLHVASDSARSVTCEFCKTDVYLPDDLWRRLHPVKTMAPWTVRFGGTSHADERAARNAEEVLRVAVESQAAGVKARRGCLHFLLVLGGLTALGIGVVIATRAPKTGVAKPSVTRGADPEAVARTSLALTPQAMASKFGGQLGGGYLANGRDVPQSGFDRPDHRCTATVCIDIRSDFYARIDLLWRDDKADHPSAFIVAMRRDHAMDLDDDARRRISALLPGGMDSWGHWYALGDRDILLDRNAGARVRVVADDAANPNWRAQLDAEWKLVMGEVFRLSLAPSPAELHALITPSARK